MSIAQRILRSNFIIKLKSWEYWPFGIIQGPIFIYWLWLSLKARSLFFFSASNPGILTGGMFGESKYQVLEKIPNDLKPKSLLIPFPSTIHSIIDKMKENNLLFPVIFKPDLGERGWRVKKITSEEDINNYLQKARWDFIIQDFVNMPLEFSVFYVRNPYHKKGKVTSVTMKEMLKVTGDGYSTLEELILAKDRAKLQWPILKKTFSSLLHSIPAPEEEIELVSVGNHCLGTTFINKNKIISEKLTSSFDRISQQIDGFYFGRYDLRCTSFEDLDSGNIKIMELNGCGAEPSHIYDPGNSLINGILDLFKHWQTIYTISKANHKSGVPYLTWKEGVRIYRKFKQATAL